MCKVTTFFADSAPYETETTKVKATTQFSACLSPQIF